jgi:hypothetical protein
LRDGGVKLTGQRPSYRSYGGWNGSGHAPARRLARERALNLAQSSAGDRVNVGQGRVLGQAGSSLRAIQKSAVNQPVKTAADRFGGDVRQHHCLLGIEPREARKVPKDFQIALRDS